MKIHSRIAFTVLGLMLFLGCRPALGQNGGQGSQRLTPQNAANGWRFVGIDPAKQTDTADPETRQARTAFWAQTLHYFAGSSQGICNGSCLASTPEFYKTQGELWVTGTFLSYKVFPIPSIHLAYTEIQFLVQSVISTAVPTGLSSGKTITLGLSGGTLLDKNQKPVSLFLCTTDYGLEPGHSYLLQLFFQSDGEFYVAGRPWDITNGTVVPDDMCDVARGKESRSQIAGTPSSQIVQRMKAILAAQ